MFWIALQPLPDAEDATLCDAFAAWSWWSLQFTPLVAQIGSALVLELSGSVRLFGGPGPMRSKPDRLLAQLFGQNCPSALVQYGFGATSLVALARLCQAPSVWNAAHGVAATPEPDALEVGTLAAAQPWVATLARLGVRTWGQLRALPRAGVARRFGSAVLNALDAAYGLRPEVYSWLTLPEVFDVRLELSAAVESAPALLFGAQRLLGQLRVWLQARTQGVAQLELIWELDARRSNALHVDVHHSGQGLGRLVLGTARATQDMAHLARLLAEQLAQVTLPAPVQALRLRSLHTQALSLESRSLLPEDVRAGGPLHQLCERLRARLGVHAVQRVYLVADHRPEAMQQWCSGMPPGAPPAPPGFLAVGLGASLAALQPGWLLEPPQRLPVRAGQVCYQGQALQLQCGPERLETGWLDDAPVLRDYYVAAGPGLGWLWLYRERPTGQGAESWYLHGWFG